MSNWAEATGQLFLGDDVFALEAPHDGPHAAGPLGAAPSLGVTSAEPYFFTAVAAARARCYLTSASFVPDRYVSQLLCEAADRGVAGRVLTASANADRRTMWHAARADYGKPLEGGVRRDEYQPTIVHATTRVVDWVWVMVGTLHFDSRSMVVDDEVGPLVRDRELRSGLEAAFLADRASADEMSVERERTTAGDRACQSVARRVGRGR